MTENSELLNSGQPLLVSITNYGALCERIVEIVGIGNDKVTHPERSVTSPFQRLVRDSLALRIRVVNADLLRQAELSAGQ